jgi:hypothetical protein
VPQVSILRPGKARTPTHLRHPPPRLFRFLPQNSIGLRASLRPRPNLRLLLLGCVELRPKSAQSKHAYLCNKSAASPVQSVRHVTGPYPPSVPPPPPIFIFSTANLQRISPLCAPPSEGAHGFSHGAVADPCPLIHCFAVYPALKNNNDLRMNLRPLPVNCWDWTKAIALPRVPETRPVVPQSAGANLGSWARCPRPQSPHVPNYWNNLFA